MSGHVDKKAKLSSLVRVLITPHRLVITTALQVSTPTEKTANASASATSIPSQTQFQTDKHLYAQLRLAKLHSRSAKRRLDFTGSYSVIKDPKTRNTELIDAVFGQ